MKDFYQKYYYGIRKFVSNKIEDFEVVEELTNDILMAGFNSLPTFNGKSEEFSWLCGIAKHKIVDYYRKKRLRTVLFSRMPILEEVADKSLGPEGEGLKTELKKEIRGVFRDLGKEYGKILRLKYMEGMKVKQIADILKISVKAAESKLIRARAKFKREWKYD